MELVASPSHLGLQGHAAVPSLSADEQPAERKMRVRMHQANYLKQKKRAMKKKDRLVSVQQKP